MTRGWARVALGAGIVVILLAGVAVEVRQLARARRWQLFGRLVSEIPRRDSVVALTIDDGPVASLTPLILDTLRVHGAHATFFVIGRELSESPQSGAALLSAGHELGNHTWSHERMWFMRYGHIRDEIERTDSLLRALGQHGAILFRPPFGYKLIGLPWYLSRTGRTTVMWSIEPDSYTLTSAEMVQHVMRRVHPGSIILLHPWYPSRGTSLAALGPMLDSLHARGYRVTTVSELVR